jgi:hypothetical protein
LPVVANEQLAQGRFQSCDGGLNSLPELASQQARFEEGNNFGTVAERLPACTVKRFQPALLVALPSCERAPEIPGIVQGAAP